MPQPGSPAIDGANALTCPQSDQRGYQRAGARCDIGAAESGGTPRPVAVFKDGFGS